MAQGKEIEIEIDEETGIFRMETFCVEGTDCEKMLDALQRALQAEKIDIEDKPEKHNAEKLGYRKKITN